MPEGGSFVKNDIGNLVFTYNPPWKSIKSSLWDSSHRFFTEWC